MTAFPPETWAGHGFPDPIHCHFCPYGTRRKAVGMVRRRAGTRYGYCRAHREEAEAWVTVKRRPARYVTKTRVPR